MEKAKEKFQHSYYEIKPCGGIAGCPMSVSEDAKLAKSFKEILDSKDLSSVFETKLKGPVRVHHKIKVALSGCVNGCSQHQIADIGIIGQRRPFIGEFEACTGCKKCIKACRENAIEWDEDAHRIAKINYDNCINCGRCIAVCPEGVFETDRQGYKIELGGRLGRHPRLAEELGDFYTLDQLLGTIDQIIDLYLTEMNGFEKISHYVERNGIDYIRDKIN